MTHAPPPRPPRDAWLDDRRLQAILDNTTAVIYVKDLDGRYLLVNRQFERIFHLARGASLGRSDHELFPPDFAAAFCANDRQVAVTNKVIEFEERVPQDGLVHTYISIKFPLQGEDGRPEAVCGISTDITERREAEERLRRLAQHLVTVREDERQRLGFDLHDGVCQELIGIGILVDAARARLGVIATPELAQVSAYLTRVGDHLRELARDLRPMLLRDLGLAGSLRALVEGLSTPALAIATDLPDDLPRLDEDLEIGLYRIAQEALVNAVRHARARHVVLTLTIDADGVHLRVRDDGRGFALDRAAPGGLGIASMEQRALALRGALRIESAPGAGTTVRLDCPPALRAARARPPDG